MRQEAFLMMAVLAAVLFISSCKEKQYLVGYYSYEEYQQVCKWDEFVDEDYKTSTKWMDSLRSLNIDEELSMQLFIGSYCPDSKKWVPRFYALKDELPIGEVSIISVDTTKKDEKGIWEDVGLKKIPTFIIYNGTDEVGRITEKPKGRLEKNLYRILKRL